MSNQTAPKQIFVVDTGTEDVYVLATEDYEAAEAVLAVTGQDYIVDVEWFSDDPADVNPDYEIVEA